MSNEEENIESPDQRAIINQQEQESKEDNCEEEHLEDFKVELAEMYDSHIVFMNAVNQIKTRHINPTLALAQIFSRYSVNQIIVFLSAAAVLAAVQGVQTLTGSYPHLTLFIGVLTTILTLAFVFVTFKNILSALTDIRRIRQGFCSIGYQIVKKKDKNDDSSDVSALPPIIAYKDYDNMIRTLTFTEEQFKKYCLMPVLTLFLDNKFPGKVTIFEDMPKNISYEYKTQTFTQDWKELKYTLIPIAMIILYAISMWMCYIAYAAIHQ